MTSTPNTPNGLTKTPLSSSLRERLKRCGRYHSASPTGGSLQSAGLHSQQTVSHEGSTLEPGKSYTPGIAVLSPRQLQDPRTPARGDEAKPPSVDSGMFKSPASLTAGRGSSHAENLPIGSSVRQCSTTSTPVLVRPRGESLRGKRLSLSLTPHSNTRNSPGTLLPQQTDCSEGGDGEESISTDLESNPCWNKEPASALEDCKKPRLSLSQPDSTPPLSSHSPRTPVSVPSSPALLSCDAEIDVCSSPLCGSQSPSRMETEKDVRSQIRSVQCELSQQNEILRKLRMVKMYRSKNDLGELQSLIDKWRQASQQALQDLHTSLPEPRPSMAAFLQHLSIPHQLVGFDFENEVFT